MRPPNCFGGNNRLFLGLRIRLRVASMRPPNCFGGNARWRRRGWRPAPCFNEARRIASVETIPRSFGSAFNLTGFNEAAELLRRKLAVQQVVQDRVLYASMRPPNCFGGNTRADLWITGRVSRASMRPPNCFGGNRRTVHPHIRIVIAASMRPPNCFGGNPCTGPTDCARRSCFNEAAELLRRKRTAKTCGRGRGDASMRPPNCFGGNSAWPVASATATPMLQ